MKKVIEGWACGYQIKQFGIIDNQANISTTNMICAEQCCVGQDDCTPIKLTLETIKETP